MIKQQPQKTFREFHAMVTLPMLNYLCRGFSERLAGVGDGAYGTRW